MRSITLATGQFGDLNLDELCKLSSSIGYEGLELATHTHFDVNKAVKEDSYVFNLRETLVNYGLECYAISAHLVGQCVGSEWDKRLNAFAPAKYSNNPGSIRSWAIEEMKTTAVAARKLGVNIVTCFMGSPIWNYWYSFPQTTSKMISDGFRAIYEIWNPIFDVFDENDIKFALEIHPTEIAFDYYTTQRLLELFNYRETLGINFDPSHLVWQGINEKTFIQDFATRIYHVHMKDVKLNRNDRAGILGSHLEFGDSRRGWNFVSVGHGDVDFDGIIRELNQIGYNGPLSIEWEDSGMERGFGAKEALDFIRKINFTPSSIAFDSTLKVE